MLPAVEIRPQADEKNYLHACFKTFRQVIQKKYGRRFDLPAIEKSVSHLRRKTPLSYSDLRRFESPKNWWFKKFWVFPPEDQISDALRKRKFDFWNLRRHEKEIVHSLYEVFRSIELVSIILRFIKPEDYGIISPPVEKVLDTRRGNDAVETYFDYLSDLREITNRYRFDRVADVDMALWVVHEKCYGEPKDPEIERSYHSDPILLSLRAKNLMGHFFSRYSYTELARALAQVNPRLAAQIGGIAFERMVRARAGGDVTAADKDLKTLIDELSQDEVIDSLAKGQWHNARRIRNKAIHGFESPTQHEIMSLLKLFA